MAITAKPKFTRLLLVAVIALGATTLTGCGEDHGLPLGAPSDFVTEGWVKTQRGYTWCLFSEVHGGASLDCDWTTLTDDVPEKYTDITK
jgi:hypothetical protein